MKSPVNLDFPPFISQWMWGVHYASTGVPVPQQECINYPGGTPDTSR